jgi:hypothetical protein
VGAAEWEWGVSSPTEPPTEEQQAIHAVIAISRSLETINHTLLCILDEIRKSQQPQFTGLFGAKR